jgi:hypothetical protein
MSAIENSLVSVRPPPRAEGLTSFASVRPKSLPAGHAGGLERCAQRRVRGRRSPCSGRPRHRVVDDYTRLDGGAAVNPRAATCLREPGSRSRTIAAANPWRSHPTANNLSVMTALHTDWPSTRAPSSRPPDCFERNADDDRTCAAFGAPALARVKQASHRPPRRRALGSRVRCKPGSVAEHASQRAELRIAAAPLHRARGKR